MSLINLSNFDRVPESEESKVQVVYTAQVMIDDTTTFITEGCLVSASREDAQKLFGGACPIWRVYIPTSIPLFWRNSSKGRYSEITGLPNKMFIIDSERG